MKGKEEMRVFFCASSERKLTRALLHLNGLQLIFHSNLCCVFADMRSVSRAVHSQRRPGLFSILWFFYDGTKHISCARKLSTPSPPQIVCIHPALRVSNSRAGEERSVWTRAHEESVENFPNFFIVHALNCCCSLFYYFLPLSLRCSYLVQIEKINRQDRAHRRLTAWNKPKTNNHLWLVGC